jgi:hypothetical protein
MRRLLRVSNCFAGSAVLTMAAGTWALAPTVHADNYLDNLPPNWAGTWHSQTTERPASLTLSSSSPVMGEVDIPGMCHATWTEVTRISDTNRLVAAHVTSGPCVDNTWNLTMAPMTLTGTDPIHNAGFSFSPNGIDPATGKPASVVPDCAQSLPLDQLTPGSEEALSRAKLLPKDFSAGMYGACAIIDAQGPNPGSQPGVYDGLCKGAESLLDPLNLGYSKNTLCGTPAG